MFMIVLNVIFFFKLSKFSITMKSLFESFIPSHIYIYIYIYILIKRPIFLVINNQLFFLYKFSKFLYIFTLFIHPSTLNITDKTPHSPDDGSAEPKRYSVDWLCFSINPHFLFGLLVNFSSQIVGLLSIIFFHIYIYKVQKILLRQSNET